MPSVNCCTNLQNISLRDLKDELKKQFKYIWSSIVFNLSIFTVTVIPLLFCGRLGKLEFASASLATSMINTLCISVANGLSTACDTYFAQMFGSSNKKGIGTVLQRSILILNTFSLIILAIIPNMESVLILMNVKPDIARMSGIFIVHFMPAVPVVLTNGVLVKYLQNNNHLLPVVCCTLTSNGASALFCYVFIYKFDMGIRGPVIALALSYYILLALLISYIFFSKMYIGTWHGWSIDCLYDWGPFAVLSLSGMLHVCLEWWCFEIGYFMAATLGKVQLGALSVTIQVAALAYMIPYGLSISASIRIGHSLGAKDTKSAKTALYVAFLGSWLCAFFVFGVMFILKDDLAKVFINDPDIVQLVAKIVPLIVIYGFFDYTGAVGNGGLRGSGHQKMGAVLNLICFYLIAMPLGGSLLFLTDLGIIGLWIGITVCLIVQGTSLFIILMNLDWELEVHKAQIRAGANKTRRSSTQKANKSEKECLNSEDCEENATELRKLSDKTSKKLSAEEPETCETLMNDSSSGRNYVVVEKADKVEDDDIKIRLVPDNLRYTILKRAAFILISVVVFVTGFLLSIVFRPTYCDMYSSLNVTVDTESDYYFDDDCIQL